MEPPSIQFESDAGRQLAEALDQAVQSIHDPDEAERVIQRLDQAREELVTRTKFYDAAVEAVRGPREFPPPPPLAGMPPTPDDDRLQDAIERARLGIRDPEEGRKAMERLARGREEMRKKFGVLDVAADLIREARNP